MTTDNYKQNFIDMEIKICHLNIIITLKMSSDWLAKSRFMSKNEHATSEFSSSFPYFVHQVRLFFIGLLIKIELNSERSLAKN